MIKNITFLSALALGMMLSFSAQAQLPDILDLPQTFGPSLETGAIDLDDDGVADFYVNFIYYSGSGSGSSYFCYILGAQSGNMVLCEGVPVGSPAPMSPPLTDGMPSWVNILPQGTSIEAIAPAGSFWLTGNPIAWSSGASSPAPTAPFYETPQGYIGVHFLIDGQQHYGWIQVSVNDAAPSVTLGSSGYASAPSTGILAGSGSVVPVPLIASLIGFLAIGTGFYFRRKRKKQ